MADPIYVIPEDPTYNPEIRALQDSDPARATTVFNPVLQQMIENTHAVKLAADALSERVTEVEQEAGDADSITLPSGQTLTEALDEINENKAATESPAFTGTPTAPTPATGTNNQQIATTEFVKKQGYAPLNSPTFTGTPKAPTPAKTSNDTTIATTAFVKSQGFITEETLHQAVNDDPSVLGADLSAAFATEISSFSSVWAWIQNRIKAGNFTGLRVGDYIPFTAGGNNYKAEIAGINTYKNYGDTAIGNHIDFITRDCHPTAFVWNKVGYNNGTSVSPNPWLASDLYARLNSLQMEVPNGTGAGGTPLVSVDYRTTGIFNTLPTALQNVIVPKRQLIPRRYTSGELLVDDNSWDWRDVGKLWLPTEVEVYGCPIWGSYVSPNQGWASGGSVQYPIFANNMRRVKGAGDGGSRAPWWLSSTRGGNSTSVCYVSSNGSADNYHASYTSIRVPLCFRVS